jgi:hypothetical protein
VQIRLSQGSLHLRIRYLAADDVYEIDTPNAAISLLRTGSYRIDVDPDRETTTVTVRGGDAESPQATPPHAPPARESGIIAGTDSISQESRAAAPPDSFDNWCMTRERRDDDRPADNLLSPSPRTLIPSLRTNSSAFLRNSRCAAHLDSAGSSGCAPPHKPGAQPSPPLPSICPTAGYS